MRLRTYRKVWRMDRLIYQIERVRLPFPISFRQMGVFAGTAAAVALLSYLPPVAAVPPLARYLLVPAAAAWYLTRQTLDGKPPHLWLRSLLRFWLSPKRLHRLEPLPRQARQRFQMHIRLGGE